MSSLAFMTPPRRGLWPFGFAWACLVSILLPAAQADSPRLRLDEGIVFRNPQIPASVRGVHRTLNERLMKGIVPQENAAVYLNLILGQVSDLAEEDLLMLGVDTYPTRLKAFQSVQEFVGSMAGRATGEPLVRSIRHSLGEAMHRPWDRFDFPDLPAYLRANDQALDRLVAISNLPQFYSPVVASTSGSRIMLVNSPLLEALEPAFRSLLARSLFRAKAGDLSKSLEDLLACRRIAMLVTRGAINSFGTLRGYAYSAVCQKAEAALLRQGELGDHALSYCRALQTLSSLPSLVDSFEREAELSVQQELELLRSDLLSKEGKTSSRLTGDLLARDIENLSALKWDVAAKAADEHHTRVMKVLRLQDRAEQTRQMVKLRADVERFQGTYDITILAFNLSIKDHPDQASEWLGKYVACLLHSGGPNLRAAEERAQVRRDLSVVGFGLAAYREEHGQFPDSLAPLAPILIPKIPSDVLGDRPLTFVRPQDGSVRVYSWGENRTDDHGGTYGEAEEADDLVIDVR